MFANRPHRCVMRPWQSAALCPSLRRTERRSYGSLASPESPAPHDLRTRSTIMLRANSATTPIIWNMALPAGIVVSIPC